MHFYAVNKDHTLFISSKKGGRSTLYNTLPRVKSVFILYSLVPLFTTAPLSLSDSSSVVFVTMTEQRILEAISQLGLDVYLCDRRNGEQTNVCVSPLTLMSVLMMIQAGSGNESIVNVVGLTSLREQELHHSVGSVLQMLMSGEAITINNAIFQAKDSTIFEEYQSLIYDVYRARVIGHLDFVHAPEICIQTVNDWISHHTNGKIKNLLHAVHPLTRLMLVTTFHFKSNWKKPFERSDSYMDYFHPENASSRAAVQTKFMMQTNFFKYTSNEFCQVLELAYTDNRYCMLFLLPHKNLSSLEKELSPDFFDRISKQLRKRELSIYLPVFQVEHESDVLSCFHRMGMVFTNLNKMTPEGGAFVDAIIQKTVVDVDEQGTEAASVTVGAIALNMRPPPLSFKANHPFMYVLMERASRTVLLIGCIQDPFFPFTKV